MTGAGSAFTRVFDALCGAGCLRSAPNGEAVLGQEVVPAKGSAGEGTDGFDAVDSAHMSKGDFMGNVCGHGYSHGCMTSRPGIAKFSGAGMPVCSQ
jgi:hypothetical protein